MSQEGIAFSLIFFYGSLAGLLFVAGILAFMFHYQNRMLQHQVQLRKQEEEKELQVVQSLIEGQENEQERIGRELHDSIATDLTFLKMELYNIAREAGADKPEAALIDTTRKKLDGVIEHVRKVSHSMIADYVLRYDLLTLIENLAEQLNATGQITATVDAVDMYYDIPDHKKLAVYRILQELIKNTIKHASATTVNISLAQKEGTHVLCVTDNGKGFNLAQNGQQQGVGLRNMYSRARAAGILLDIQSAPQQGTVATITF